MAQSGFDRAICSCTIEPDWDLTLELRAEHKASDHCLTRAACARRVHASYLTVIISAPHTVVILDGLCKAPQGPPMLNCSRLQNVCGETEM